MILCVYTHITEQYFDVCLSSVPPPPGLSPPTAYAAFPTAPAILSEAALYQPPLLAAPRPPQTTAHSPHTMAYYPHQPHLYMNMNMNYTAYYPRLEKSPSLLTNLWLRFVSFRFSSFIFLRLCHAVSAVLRSPPPRSVTLLPHTERWQQRWQPSLTLQLPPPC